MNVVKCDLPRDIKTLEIHTFADLHIGDAFCDMQLIKKNIKEVQDNPDAYIVLNGDILNNATKTSVSDSYAEEIPPMEQIQTAVDLFEPIKDKILCINSGNHENRTYKKEGIDLMAIVAKQLGIYEKYSKESSFLFIRFGEASNKRKESKGTGKIRKMCYTLYCNHGSGGGRKEGAKAIRLADMASIVDADIYLHSHTHLPMIMKQSFFRVDIQNSYIANVNKLFVNTSAMLKYGGYGEQYEFKPSSTDSPTIYLNGTKKQMYARL